MLKWYKKLRSFINNHIAELNYYLDSWFPESSKYYYKPKFYHEKLYKPNERSKRSQSRDGSRSPPHRSSFKIQRTKTRSRPTSKTRQISRSRSRSRSRSYAKRFSKSKSRSRTPKSKRVHSKTHETSSQASFRLIKEAVSTRSRSSSLSPISDASLNSPKNISNRTIELKSSDSLNSSATISLGAELNRKFSHSNTNNKRIVHKVTNYSKNYANHESNVNANKVEYFNV